MPSSETKRYYVEQCERVWSRCVVEVSPEPAPEDFDTQDEFYAAHEEWVYEVRDAACGEQWEQVDGDFIGWGEIEPVD